MYNADIIHFSASVSLSLSMLFTCAKVGNGSTQFESCTGAYCVIGVLFEINPDYDKMKFLIQK